MVGCSAEVVPVLIGIDGNGHEDCGVVARVGGVGRSWDLLMIVDQRV